MLQHSSPLKMTLRQATMLRLLSVVAIALGIAIAADVAEQME